MLPTAASGWTLRRIGFPTAATSCCSVYTYEGMAAAGEGPGVQPDLARTLLAELPGYMRMTAERRRLDEGGYRKLP